MRLAGWCLTVSKHSAVISWQYILNDMISSTHINIFLCCSRLENFIENIDFTLQNIVPKIFRNSCLQDKTSKIQNLINLSTWHFRKEPEELGWGPSDSTLVGSSHRVVRLSMVPSSKGWLRNKLMTVWIPGMPVPIYHQTKRRGTFKCFPIRKWNPEGSSETVAL